jgi:hypothetical protein
MKWILICLLVLAVSVGTKIISYAQNDSLRVTEDKEIDAGDVEGDAEIVPEKIFAYYLHGDRRCATCRKLEAYSEEALREGFPELLEDSTLIWGTINYDQEENEHFLKDYNLFTKAVILSRVRDGNEIEWKNLDRIWDLVKDKEKFLKYVQEETEAFLIQGNK